MGGWQSSSLNKFHFLDGIPVFLGQWYPEGFHSKSMVLKTFIRGFYGLILG